MFERVTRAFQAVAEYLDPPARAGVVLDKLDGAIKLPARSDLGILLIPIQPVSLSTAACGPGIVGISPLASLAGPPITRMKFVDGDKTGEVFLNESMRQQLMSDFQRQLANDHQVREIPSIESLMSGK